MTNKINEMRKLINDFQKIIIKENVNNVDVPKYLYHATFKPLLKKIKYEGLGGTSAKQLWDDSKKGVVYLALDPNVAYSYAETVFDENDDIPESWEKKIIILVIDTENLNKDKFYLDTNVLDNEGDTVEYHGIIPFDAVVSIKTEDNLGKVTTKENTYLGSCVEVGDDNSCNYINDIFSDATEMAYYVGNPDDDDFGKSEEISREEFLKNIDISVVKPKKLKGDVGFYYIPNLKMYYIYNFDDGIHYFYQ